MHFLLHTSWDSEVLLLYGRIRNTTDFKMLVFFNVCWPRFSQVLNSCHNIYLTQMASVLWPDLLLLWCKWLPVFLGIEINLMSYYWKMVLSYRDSSCCLFSYFMSSFFFTHLDYLLVFSTGMMMVTSLVMTSLTSDLLLLNVQAGQK